MDRALSFLGGAAIGAVTMYYFDPDRGRGRRSACEDQWAARGRRAVRDLDKAGRDLAHRAQGLAHEARHLVRGETPANDGHRPISFDVMNEHFAPGTRLLLGVLGGGLFAWGVAQDAPEACVLGTIGAALALPALTGYGAGVFHGRESAQEQPRVMAGQSTTAATERRGEPVPVM
jgi:hypothetical protein